MSKAHCWLMFVLNCHDEQLKIITDAVRRDLYRTSLEIERLYTTITGGAIRYDDAGTSGGSADDDRVAEVLDKIDELKAAQEERCKGAYEKMQKIREVERLVRGLEKQDRDVLLALYYPRRTMKQATQILKISERDVGRKRDAAVKELFYACQTRGLF